MKIVVVSSEVTPFAKTGGLADVAGALPRALKKMGHDVRIIMPFYRMVEKGGFSIRKGRKSIEVRIDSVMKKGLLRWTELDDIPVYLIECPEFFQRDYIYGTPTQDYPDNPMRFAFFCRGILQLLKKMDFRPDIIHCNDWPTAIIPLLLRTEQKEDPFFMRTATVFTIHNLAYQGVFQKESLPKMNFDWSLFSVDRLEFFDKVNLMKGGILSADMITTVSTSYAKEVLTPEYGCGLDGILRQRSEDLAGILNGIDTTLWNPETDPNIFQHYGAGSSSGKAANKKGLQKQLGLPVESVPVFGMVTRLVSQKGIELIEELIPTFADSPMQLVILGNGDQRYVEMMTDLKKRGIKNISINDGFQSPLAHRIYAGSDMFLMPSRFEPCGLGQLIAQRYGSVPVVRMTGGLIDTVTDISANPKSGNGFVFGDFSAGALWEAMRRGMEMYEDKKEWKKIVRKCMTADHSWEPSARRYEEIYQRALEKKALI